MNQLNKWPRFWLIALRLSLGWLMFYAGITKVINPAWSAAGYLTNAKTLSGFYSWLAQPGILPIVNFINEWGLTLLGVSLILGIGVRLSSSLGVVLMLLYYFPAGNFPFVDHGFLIEEHIIYATALGLMAAVNAGRYFGFDEWCGRLPLCQRYPWIKKIWG